MSDHSASSAMLRHRYGDLGLIYDPAARPSALTFGADVTVDQVLAAAERAAHAIKAMWQLGEVDVRVSSGIDPNGQPWAKVSVEAQNPMSFVQQAVWNSLQGEQTLSRFVPLSWEHVDGTHAEMTFTRGPAPQ